MPTTLNVGGIDLIHPENYQGNDADFAQKSARQMEMYKEMGCRPIFTCAPYQVSQRPALGMQIAWAESNAIVFANLHPEFINYISVLQFLVMFELPNNDFPVLSEFFYHPRPILPFVFTVSCSHVK